MEEKIKDLDSKVRTLAQLQLYMSERGLQSSIIMEGALVDVIIGQITEIFISQVIALVLAFVMSYIFLSGYLFNITVGVIGLLLFRLLVITKKSLSSLSSALDKSLDIKTDIKAKKVKISEYTR